MLAPILLGSEVDKPHAEKIASILSEFDIPYKIIVCSAHKVPEKLFALVQKYNKYDEGSLCYVTIAGRSNGLSGCTAGSSIHPVVACPPFKDKADFMVNINSTLQMPSETPVLTAIDPNNAALAVVRILALSNKELQQKVAERIQKVKDSFTVDL